MRISGGRARSIPLLVPKGDCVRPATDGLRQAVFSSLGSRVGGASFLDLFAGSGGYGLEALSRGAAGGSWVERHPRALEYLRRNLAAVCRSLGRNDEGLRIVQADAVDAPWPEPTPPDLVFVDPPYDLVTLVAPPIFARLNTLLGGHRDPLVMFEVPGEVELAPPGWDCVKRLGKGAHQPTVVFFRRAASRG